ncbi:hypothetical protein P170DRAFT_439054 [Aspergillus steynii IBT 23096]|uniref:Uncharacterized protein n=1 Tax=Aspergillus steynii IBT 23096 TaxID=1392250 RepID=A0A2I2G3C3_9EURO|nr:uncharacterized protein P170DRAFT_439054 [Aspergillus steynii IBT 23096]PLB47376.1 hypothetical protein P170DRAFT_439054 [Aspergillus steynii IBT 23096]
MRLSITSIVLSLCVLPSIASPMPAPAENSALMSKRCCILCDNPYARCGSNDKREAFETEEGAISGLGKRCSINSMNPAFRCGSAPSE